MRKCESHVFAKCLTFFFFNAVVNLTDIVDGYNLDKNSL